MLMALLFSSVALADPVLPPAELFHVGDRSALEEDGNAGTVPQKAWDEFVVGDKTTWQLAEYRRGLYGSDDLDGLEFYLSRYNGSAVKPWMMKIKVKEACRNPEQVSALYLDERYGNWILAHINEILKEFPACLDVSSAKEMGCSALVVGNIAHVNANSIPCDRWVLRYLEENKIKVVKDTPWLDSWYLRDRDCIEKIQAGPEEILHAMAGAKWDSATRELTGNAIPNGGGFLRLLLGALGSSDHANPADIAAIRQKAAASDLDSSRGRPEAKATRWVSTSFPPLIDAYQRCEQQNHLSAFREPADQFQKFCTTFGSQDKEKFLGAVDTMVASLQKACR